MNPRTIVLLYELGQVEELEYFWRTHPEARANALVIAFDIEIETKLARQGIAFVSVRSYKHVSPTLFADEDAMMSAFFADERWTSFTYRGVAFTTLFLHMFRSYLQRVGYYGSLISSVADAHPEATCFALFAPREVISKTYGPLAGREIHAVIDCAKIVAARGSMQVDVIPLSGVLATLRSRGRPVIFALRRATFSVLLAIWNALMTIFYRPRHPRLVISDYWRHVGSSLELLPKAECIFLDRTEIRAIPWRMLLRYRMRFVHTENFLSRQVRIRAGARARQFARVWRGMRPALPPVFTYRGHSFDALLLNALDDLMLAAEKIICEIEGTYALYTRLAPDLVLLRTSVSGQAHFSVLPLVAQQCGIPSLELQHGLEYLGPGSWSREHVAAYLAVYGSLVKKELVSLGYKDERVRLTGSPRFDRHPRGEIETADRPFTVLCIAPEIRTFALYDSYSAEAYLAAVAKAAQAAGARSCIKLRAGPSGEGILRVATKNAFANMPHEIAQQESLPTLFARADVVVSGYSTAILESLYYGVPVIIPALTPPDAAMIDFHFAPYRDAGALSIAYMQEELDAMVAGLAREPELRARMRTSARAFLAKNFCFDGKSSARVATFITELTA